MKNTTFRVKNTAFMVKMLRGISLAGGHLLAWRYFLGGIPHTQKCQFLAKMALQAGKLFYSKKVKRIISDLVFCLFDYFISSLVMVPFLNFMFLDCNVLKNKGFRFIMNLLGFDIS